MRKLQHGRGLAFDQTGQQNDFATGEFERIVMRRRLVKRDLTKARHPLADLPFGHQREVRFGLDIAVERHLGPRHQTDRDIGLTDSSETAGHRCWKPGGHQPLTGGSRSGRNMLQAVVAHQKPPS
jgi:hypothetical protein